VYDTNDPFLKRPVEPPAKRPQEGKTPEDHRE
jgi:hypothetical protein